MPKLRTARRVTGLVGALLLAGVTLSACVFAGAEPAPGSPPSPDGYSTEGFPPPGPPPQPGVITPDPVAPVARSDEPRPREGPVPTEGPRTSENEEPPSGGAPAPPPGS